MPTIAELQINVDSTPLERATKGLTDFANASEKAANAGKSRAQSESQASQSTEKSAQSEKKLADLIDYQTRKLSALAAQRELVARSGLKDTASAEYARLNSIIDAQISLVQRQGNAQDVLAAKQDRDIAKLQNIATAYDPVARAVLNYERNLKSIEAGYESGKLSVDQYTAALAAQQAQLERVRSAQPDSSNSEARRYQEALDKLVPYRTELRNLAEQQRILDQRRAGGGLAAAEVKEIDLATEAIKRQTTEYKRRIAEGNNFGNSLKQDQQALRGLPAQFTDIVVSLQGGQAPLTVLLQQGGQIKDTFGGIVPALKGVATGLAAIITPATVAGAAILGIGYAAFDASKELEDFNKATILSGGRSGVSASGFAELRSRLDDTTSTSRAAAAALTEIQASGKIAEDSFYAVAEAALNFERATGQAVKQTVEDFASLGKDPVNAAISLDEKYKFLTASVLAQASALKEQGREQEAITLLQNTLADATDAAAKRIIEQAGYITQAWNGVKRAVSESVDAVYDIGRVRPAGEQVADLEKEIEVRKRYFESIAGENKERAKSLIADDYYIKNQQKKLDALRPLAAAEEAQAKADKQREDQRRAAVAFTNTASIAVSAGESEVVKLQKEQKKAQEGRAKAFLDAADQGKLLTDEQITLYDKYESDIQRRLDEAVEREKKKADGPSSPVDSRAVTEVKSNLDLITNEYDNYYKKVTALGKNNVVSEAATIASQRAILEAQKNATISSYDEQIAAIKSLQGVKGNSAAQNISLDNQLTKAEAARLKAQQDFTAKQEQLADRDVALTEKKRASIEAYQEALRQQVDNVVTSGNRAVDAVGRGDRQGAVNEQLADVDRQFAKDQLSLEKQYASRSLDTEEYTKKLKLLEDTHSELTETIISNDDRLRESQADWSNGVTRALENLADSANNVAGAVDSALSGAFDSAGRALGDFVVTGKFSFSDFASSVISDMARIAAQQASSQALSALFGVAASAAGSFFGNGFALGSAGARSSSLGASSAGYSSQYIPKFAKGGVFSNSIVSSPTNFNMAQMGEAGPEAIIPLSRTGDGSLGVRLSGGSAGSEGSMVNVNVVVNSDGSSSASSDGGSQWQGFGDQLGIYINQQIRTIINKETRPGGSIQPQK